MIKTYQPSSKEIKREWHLLDAKGQILGRLSTQIANFLIGKHKVGYSRHIDSGDFVVVINAEKIELTGKKKQQKVYRSHSGYPGGYKEVTFSKMIDEHPDRVIRFAVSGMLPDNRLKDRRLSRLKIVIGDKSPFKNKIK
jgi:large subunit ribosomal protein L13